MTHRTAVQTKYLQHNRHLIPHELSLNLFKVAFNLMEQSVFRIEDFKHHSLDYFMLKNHRASYLECTSKPSKQRLGKGVH